MRSCETQLLTIVEHWTKYIDSNQSIDVVYLDFQKAFDEVPHNRLLSKLKSYELTGMVLNWILSNKRQKVVVRSTSSKWSSVISGVPQGSVLGPTLFIIYVNDLPDVIQSYVGIFADDTKIYHPITSPIDYDIFQVDINSALQWCDVWLSFFNSSKCHHNRIGSSSSIRQYYLFSSDDITHPITVVSNERDLGVTFDRDLKFIDHIKTIVQKANNVLGIIKRTFTCRDATTIRLLYTTLICSPNFRLLFHCLESSPFKKYLKARISPEKSSETPPGQEHFTS